MSSHEPSTSTSNSSSKKSNRSTRSINSSNLSAPNPPPSSTTTTSKSPITTPPRAAIHHGRTKTIADDSASLKSSKSNRADETTLSDSETPSPSTECPLCTQKDLQIQSLTTELEIMSSEFSKELTHLSHKLTNESETAQFWMGKHSSTHQLYLKSDTELRLLRQEEKKREEGGKERDREIKGKIESLLLDRDAFREAYNEAMKEVGLKEEELGRLRGVVGGLKRWVSRAGVSGGGEQVADEVVGEGWGRLGNGVQNWVIVNFRRVKIDPSKADNEAREQLLRLVPTYETLATTSKIHFIQSLVSKLIVENVFEAYFAGLPKEHAEELSKVEKYLSGFSSKENMNQWRSITLSLLRKDAPQKIQDETDSIVNGIIQQVNKLMASISDAQHTEARDQTLRTLITSSIELSRLLRIQKAVFSIMMPAIEGHQQTMFDATTMEDIGGEDEDTLNEREIVCVAFPGIVKSGDENGERTHLRNVVAKMKVLCAPD